MKIGILGGSFNPPHIGHVFIARQILEKLGLDEIWLTPAYSHPFNKKLVSTKHRLAMTKLLVDTNIKVSDFEISQKKISYTIDTLKKLKEEFPDDNFYWIIGSDQLEEFKKWKDWAKLVSDYQFVIFPRPKLIVPIDKMIRENLGLRTIPKHISFLEPSNLVLIEISSTVIRNRVKSKKSIKFMTPASVEEYIKKNKLYE